MLSLSMKQISKTTEVRKHDSTFLGDTLETQNIWLVEALSK